MHILAFILLILGIILIAAGIAGIMVLFLRKVPTVALINVKNVPVDKTAKMKEQIIAERILRNFYKKTAPVRKVTNFGWVWIQNRFRRVAKLAFDLERRSEMIARESWDALTAASRIHALEHEAEALMKADKLPEAEKKYIQALAMDMKNAKLYEDLGNLYLRMKQYDQARETLRFAARISPNDASVITSLGEIALAQKSYNDAVTYFQHAVALRPRSPRYLDFLLEACIMGNNQSCALETLAKLIAVNPENAKIHEFEKRLKEMV